MNIEPQDVDCKPLPSPEQQVFLDELDAALDIEQPDLMLRLLGGPGCGKSFTLARAAERAAEAGWAVMLIGPTHQAVGVLATAVPVAYPYEPDSRTGLSAGTIVTATAHRMAQWVQKSRAKGAAAGETDPVPQDSWLGRSLKLDWLHPPKGLLVLADEISMYTHSMSRAIFAVLATVRNSGARTVLVGIGDPYQLVPVRGPHYTYEPDEQPTSPSLMLTVPVAHQSILQVNQRAKHPALRAVVQNYLQTQQVLPPYGMDCGEAYSWRRTGDSLWRDWAALIEISEPGDCIMLGYRRATVAYAGDRIHRMLHGGSPSELVVGRYMRVQETFSPRGRTLAASSDLVEVVDLTELDADDAREAVLPPSKGHRAAHEEQTLAVLQDLVSADVERHGPLPAAVVRIIGDRAGVLRGVPAQVVSQSNIDTPSALRWGHLVGAISHAAFRVRYADDTIRRGMAAIYYHLADAARIKLESPYAMTSHRSQGSTFKHVLVLADGREGGPIVDMPDARTRHSSSYVMLSRASQTLTIGWV